MIYYKISELVKPVKAIEVEGEVTFGHTPDSDGEVMFINTHFTSEAEAKAYQISSLLSGIESAQREIDRLQKTVNYFESMKDSYHMAHYNFTKDSK